MKKAFWLVLIAITVLRLVLIARIGPTNDEAYYWLWSRHPALSYYDHPPMVALVISVFTSLFGTSAFSLHLSGLFFMTLFAVLVYLWAREMFPSQGVEWGVLSLMLAPIFFLGSLVISPDAVMSVFWVAASWAVYRALKTRLSYYWYLSGIAVGLGVLSKYVMFLVAAQVFLYLIFSERDRFWLKRKEPYAFMLIAILMFLPVLIWNASHDWASFSFQAVERHSVHFSALRFLRYILVQMLHISPVAWVLAMVSFYFLWRKGFFEKKWEMKYLFFISFPVVMFFSSLSFFSTVLSHWPAFGYAGGLMALPAAVKSDRRCGFLLRLNALLCLAIAGLYMSHIFYPVIDMKKDPTDDLFGWDAVAKEVKTALAALNDDTFLLCERYETGSQLAFSMRGEVYVLSPLRTTGFRFWQDEGSLVGRDALYVTHSRYFVPPSNIYRFRKCTLLSEVPVYRRGREVRTFYIYVCEGFRGLKKQNNS